MLSESEARILLGDADELILLAVFEAIRVRDILLGPQVVESVTIEDFGILVLFGVV